MFVRKYLIPRLLQYFLVIFLGITIVFFIPRLAPTNPVERTIAEIRSAAPIWTQLISRPW